MIKSLVMMIKATTTTPVAPAATNTKVHWHTIEFSHNTRTHMNQAHQNPAHQHVQQAETLTPQPARRKHAPHTGKQQTVKEPPPQPPTQPTTRQLTSSCRAAVSATTKNATHPTHTPQTPSTQPQKEANLKQKRDRTRDPFPSVTTSAI